MKIRYIKFYTEEKFSKFVYQLKKSCVNCIKHFIFFHIKVHLLKSDSSRKLNFFITTYYKLMKVIGGESEIFQFFVHLFYT